MSTLQTQRNDLVFEKRLEEALSTALGGQCALVIVPNHHHFPGVFNWLVQHAPPERAYQVRRPGNELHFEGTRGSVRLYSAEHPEYDRRLKRLLGYPHSISLFLHPEVEGL